MGSLLRKKSSFLLQCIFLKSVFVAFSALSTVQTLGFCGNFYGKDTLKNVNFHIFSRLSLSFLLSCVCVHVYA